VSTTLVGVLLGLVVYRTRSIFAGMAMHAIWNLLPLLAVSALRNVALPGYDFQSPEIHHVPVPALVVSAGIVWLGLRGLWRHTEGLQEVAEPETVAAATSQGATLGGLPPDPSGPDGPHGQSKGPSGAPEA
jgi:hypothetical protein